MLCGTDQWCVSIYFVYVLLPVRRWSSKRWFIVFGTITFDIYEALLNYHIDLLVQHLWVRYILLPHDKRYLGSTPPLTHTQYTHVVYCFATAHVSIGYALGLSIGAGPIFRYAFVSLDWIQFHWKYKYRRWNWSQHRQRK